MMADTAVAATMSSDRGPVKKRRRVVISCTECHRRKQKCDRELPCGNCKSRSKESRCTYEAGAPTAREYEMQSNILAPSRQNPAADRNGEPLSSAASAWGYSQTGTSTMCFLQKIERAINDDDSDQQASAQITPASRQDSFAIKEKYKGLIRLLPAKTYLDQLIDKFFTEFNWQYNLVEQDVFHQQLEEWHSLPFKLLSTQGPDALTPDLKVFPAMLFQVIATTLLVLPEEFHAGFEALKYAANMTMEDLAIDYSESGAAIVNLFGKKSLSLTGIQSQFLRAAFLKYTANVTESWHTIGVVIRDAQELGMHRDSLDPKPASSAVEAVLENQWFIERRRFIYMVLSNWDIHMSLLLGRPGALDWRHSMPSQPVDAPIPKHRSKTPVIPRDATRDHPTPITRNLTLYKILNPLRDIQDLEPEGPCPKDFSKVDRVHEKIMKLQEEKPAILRHENPDRQWDEHPDVVRWIQPTRYFLEQMHAFTLMALHRPYVFHREKSRLAALSASIHMLEIQRQNFIGLPPKSWKNWHLFYGNFDAVILIATIYILFPYEQPELRGSALQHCRWAVERFAAMKGRNPLADSAFGVLNAVVTRLVKAIGNCAPASTSPTVNLSDSPASTRTTAETTPTSLSSKTPYPQGSITTSITSSSAAASAAAATATVVDEASNSFAVVGMPSAWTMPSDGNDFSGIAPMYAISDLIYNDLTVTQDGDFLPPPGPDALGGDALPWQFEGDFGQDTVWQFLNQYPFGANDRV